MPGKSRTGRTRRTATTGSTGSTGSTGGLPAYDELPVGEGKPKGSSWGLWGDDDVWGCLNLLNDERLLRATGSVRKGMVFNLNLELELPKPPLFGRPAFEHIVHGGEGRFGHDDELTGWNTQSSSQWDGFRHIRNPVHGFYNGVEDASHGVHHWARRGIAGRGVLADIGRWRQSQGRPLDYRVADPIDPSELPATLEAQGTEVEVGDVLLIRTGWVSWYRGLDEEGRAGLGTNLAAPGLTAGEETARVLWNLHVAAVAADNPALEVFPPAFLASPQAMEAMRKDLSVVVDQFVHMRLLPLLGLPIGELFDLDALADDCAADREYTCLLTSAPLNLTEGVASPPNALAIR